MRFSAPGTRHGIREARRRSGLCSPPSKVDNPDDEVDNTPQFDKEGEPNFDEHGNYQGCHGMGCPTDDPGDDDSSE
ncbi:hypothetical protein D8666_22400 [Ochrobactrum soli]|nr:hypothetical protein D8666_22400 [[Ochrobactrum] soli]